LAAKSGSVRDALRSAVAGITALAIQLGTAAPSFAEGRESVTGSYLGTTALVVAGGDLFAYGNGEKPIQFSSQSQSKQPGSWRGVVLNGAKRTDLRHVTIEGAVVGLTIRDSAPSITAATVRGCSQAGLHLKDRARPNIVCSLFKDNEGQGGVVIEGEGVSPTIRNNVFQGNLPFQVQSYTPLKMNLSENFWGYSEPQAELFLGDIVWQPALPTPPGNCAERQW